MESTESKTLLGKKFANALLDTTVKQSAVTAADIAQMAGTAALTGFPVGGNTNQALSTAVKFVGGVWVEGVLSLYSDELRFEANTMNRAIQTGVLNVSIPMRSVVSATRRFGYITGIIDVVWTNDGQQQNNSFRCFNAKAFAQKITTAVHSL